MKTLDRAPLKLTHDATPMDVSYLQSQSNPLQGGYRFQGFPAHNFSEGTKPRLGPPRFIEDDMFNRSFRKRQHFVKGIPGDVNHDQKHEAFADTSRVNEPAFENVIEYGSRGMLPSRTEPFPLKTLFFKEDITSADERKRTTQINDAEEDIARFKSDKMAKHQNIQEEKKMDLQMLKDYLPWGKPGAGAPKPQNIARTKAVDTSILYEADPVLEFPAFGMPGHGAPMRTDSGHVITNIRANHDIRFHDMNGMKEAVNNHTRYAVPCKEGKHYAETLGNMVLEKKTQREMEKYQDKMEEKETWKHDPFGQPGGGAPLKTDSGRLQTRHNITLMNDLKEMRDVEHRHTRKDMIQSNKSPIKDNEFTNELHFQDDTKYDPWGKGTGAPHRDEKGGVIRYQWAKETGVKDYIDPKITGGALETKSIGGGGFNVDAKGEKRTKFALTLDHAQTGGPILKDNDKVQSEEGFDPWGKPGGGAPLTDRQGQRATGISGKMMTDKFGFSKPNDYELKAKRDYLSELKYEINEQQEQKRSLEKEINTPGNDVAPWIRVKEIGYPKKDPVTGVVLPLHHKGISDVTKQRMDIRRPAKSIEAMIYSSDLERQAMERHLNKTVEKQVSRDLSAQHHTNFDRAWGKPGHGAPKTTNNRLSLDMEKEYQKTVPVRAPWATYSL